MIHEIIGALIIITGVVITIKGIFKRKKVVKRKPYVHVDILVFLN